MISTPFTSSLAVLLAVVGLGACGLHGDRGGAAAQAAPAATTTAAAARVVAPGIVEPFGGEIALAAKEPGWLAQLLVAEGDVVSAGQLLAVLDDERQRAAVAVAQAEVAEAEALLAGNERGATAAERRQVRAEADADVARAAEARRDASRLERLHAADAATTAEVERARAQADAAEAQARASAARWQATRDGARVEDRRASRARLQAARARLGRAEAELARRRVVAPDAGTVLLGRYHVGEQIDGAGAPLFVLGNLDRLQLRIEVDELDAGRVVAGQACAVVGDDGHAVTTGVVVRVAPRLGRRRLTTERPTARADVRVREVFVELPADARLAPGQRLWGHIAVEAQHSAP